MNTRRYMIPNNMMRSRCHQTHTGIHLDSNHQYQIVQFHLKRNIRKTYVIILYKTVATKQKININPRLSII